MTRGMRPSSFAPHCQSTAKTSRLTTQEPTMPRAESQGPRPTHTCPQEQKKRDRHVPVTCPLGRSTPSTHGHSRPPDMPAHLRTARLTRCANRPSKQWVSAWPLSSLAGPPLAGSSLSLSGLRHLLRGVRLGDHFPGGIQHRLDYGAINSSGKPDDDPAPVVR
jgi:hypothetical protein